MVGGRDVVIPRDSISMNYLRRARVFLCPIIQSMATSGSQTTSFSWPFPVTHCSLIADIVLGRFFQIGHELSNGSGEQGSVIDCPTSSRTVTGTDTKHKQESVHVGA